MANISVFGVRSIPPSDGSGGSETYAVELYSRLVLRGHNVTVYCRKYFFHEKKYPRRYKNIKLIYLPTIKIAGIDTFFHSFLSTMHILLFNSSSIVHIHNAGNSIFVLPLRFFGINCYVSMDGIDWNRLRWNSFARTYLKLTNNLAFKVCNKVIIDNDIVKKFYENNYAEKIKVIYYGANILNVKTYKIPKSFGLTKNQYILFIGRFSKEKGVHHLINAFEKTNTNLKLVIVGDDLFNKAWVKKLKSTKDKRIIFTGYLYGNGINELIQNCFLYVQPSEVEGLSPVILRVMGMGKCVLSSDIPANKKLVENNGYLFKNTNAESLKNNIEYLIENEQLVNDSGAKSLEFVKNNYSWDSVTDKHEKIFLNKLG